MKLSELSNDQAAEIMIRLSGPLGAICDDEDAVKMVDEYKKRYRMPMFYSVGKLIPQLVGHLMKKHKSDLYEIISILTERKPDEVGQMNFAQTIQALRDSYDETLAVFMKSSASAIGSGGTK